MKTLLAILLPVLLSGCLAARVEVTYNEKMQPVNCHAAYWSLARDVEAAAFSVCGSSANLQKASGSEALRKVIETALGAALALP
jgi:hypothetical protein